MTSVTIPSGAIPTLVEDIGRLIGLLVASGSDLELDFGWFAGVPANLSKIPDRRAEQWTLLQDLLKTPSPAPSGQDSAQQWYNLPFLANVTPLSLVLDPASSGGGGGVVGVGVANQWAAGKASVAASAFSPLFDTAGQSFVVVGNADYPIVLALACTLDQALPVGTDSIDGVTLLCHFSPDGTSAPGFSLNFTGPNGALPVVDSLQRLVQSDATAWANAALGDAAVKQWLDQNVGSSTITRGAANRSSPARSICLHRIRARFCRWAMAASACSKAAMNMAFASVSRMSIWPLQTGPASSCSSARCWPRTAT
jgi:hypothetical protein